MTATSKTQSTKQNYSKTQTLWQSGKDKNERPCIWMQAGVVSQKNCNHYYDCTSCKYDTAMGKQATAGKHISWQEALRKRDSIDRTCRHALTGRADHRTCPMNYNCYKCDFDQMFEDTLSPGQGHIRLEMKDVKGFKIPNGYYFHSGHTWTSIDSGGFIRVGMDDFAFKVLGGPDGFDLPLMGQELNHDKPGWGIKRNQNLGDVLSPINGVITKVNQAVATSPDIPEKMPYQDGWLFTVHNSDIKGAMKHLMADEDSEAWLNGEVTTLEEMIENVTGPLSADGGLLTRDIFGTLPALGWKNLTNTFLRT
ncbi:MAG: glycine cleavage system protein H [Proteobacteria bacterium]|nr:glycine cleavage system protein H [Pseudomonadota bacterium]MBU1583791.1 glycine cleavage system protein H [Pseudomonadota bacterium]MBU2451812.1 glycine cleavage system protein H [Pseudomonadota bacterium]MBU2630509.1 glycine cleavage system protein H [Pseudomonadota bacterium]